MRTTTRTVGAGLLAAVVGLLAGCGGGGTPAPAPGEKDKPAAAVTPSPAPGGGTTDKPAPPPADPYQLDPAAQVIPDAPLNGRLVKEPFQPTAVALGDTLMLRAGKEDGPAREVSIKLSAKQASAAAAGTRVVVKEDAAAGDDTPEVMVSIPDRPTPVVYPNGYGMTLELGKREKGRARGRRPAH